MKTFLFLILLSVHSSVCFGDALGENLKALNSVRAERESTLKAIVAQLESGVKDGTSGMSELIEAQINLLEHVRGGENSARKKIVPQQKIVKLEETRHALVERLMRSGNISSIEYLKSKERFLAAKQLLLEYKVKVTSNTAIKVESKE